MTDKKHHRGTNGGNATHEKCCAFTLSVRFQVELAYLMEGTFAGAARELNRKRIKSMYGCEWYPATVQRAINLYAELDQRLAEAFEKESDTSKAAKETISDFKAEQ